MNTQTKCYHNRPYKDENPAFFEYDNEASCNNEFGDLVQYKCKYCKYELVFDIFEEECQIFEKKFGELNKSNESN